MTDKALASMARYGRKVTFLIDGRPDVVGYVIGFDDESVRIAVVAGSEIEVKLRSRNYIVGYDSDDANSMKNEPCADDLEFMAAPFRAWVMRKYFPEHTAS